ncbi:hypothetical protein L288_12700 [Sphingobium quisquiliarum P25]|uniref:DUF3489 domain-containing protein n=1 Tax=Sphingobium quisquiliarum P25 TaxID=1329909 RepID=T0H045_9SPHN|nr:DUF3489 domain-containing protein [Sphingobium quisquiliarum]EQB05498.1 hypothetical protein L288_12700 [Sphingobium quisquiliarum P25]
MTKLSDLQYILLSAASRRDDGNLYPLPAGVDPRGGAKAAGALVRRHLAEERSTAGAEPSLHITAAGLKLIGVEPDVEIDSGGAGDSLITDAPPMRPNKAALLLALVQRPGGAVIAELTEATGWLPHTVRAALTGLRKKGHAVERGTRDGKTCYRCGAAA